MRAISVIGTSKTGKTTTIEGIIQELTKRGYSVGSIKEIHFHAFKMDIEGTNTDRHKKAGATLVTARGDSETDILFQEKLSINEILSFYDHDFVIMEGVRDAPVPKIVTASSIEAIEDRFDETVFAISGVVSEKITEYKSLPAINALTHIKELVDLIEEKSFPLLPAMKDECCMTCGYTCEEFCGRILKGLSKREDCVLSKSGISLKIGGKDITMVPFVQKIIQNTLEALVKELDGYTKDGDIEICIKK
ncbi:MAG: molybdopterin-guanine dinucleotide biosynthesis protein B [Gudongella sp.]|nr:molybdopterin-guanine dinucleotide biosynthesis protein B [Gudongella sp.]